MSSLKVRHPEAVHYPEYAGWHRKAQGDPTDPRRATSQIWQNGVVELSRQRELWGVRDPNARYGPETIFAMPKADDKLKEDLFDETADQKVVAKRGTPDRHLSLLSSWPTLGIPNVALGRPDTPLWHPFSPPTSRVSPHQFHNRRV